MIRRLFHMPLRSTLPRLKHHLTSGRKLDSKDDGVQALLEAGLVRDWTNAKMLMKSSGKSADELFWELSRKRRPPWRKRLRAWIAALDGGWRIDPHKHDFEQIKRGSDRFK